MITAMLLIGGVTQLPQRSTEDAKPSPFVIARETTVDDRLPLVDAVVEPLASPETEELRRIANQLRKDAELISQRARDLRPMTLTSEASPMACECTCDCDCPDEALMRQIVREELQAMVDAVEMGVASAPAPAPANAPASAGSAGGSVPPPIGYQGPPTYLYVAPSLAPPANGSAGGTLQSGQAYRPLTRPLNILRPLTPRAARIAARLTAPLANLQGSKVTIHTFASGQACPACDGWLATVAPRLQADGVTVTQIADITSGSAPQIDVCKDNVSCLRLSGAVSYSQILRYLR